MMIKVYDTMMNRYVEHFFIDCDNNIWLDSDPNGVDMSGKKRIYMANPDRYKLEIKPSSTGE